MRPPYQNSSDLDLSDLTTTPLAFLNDVIFPATTTTGAVTVCVNVPVTGAMDNTANYVYAIVSSFLCDSKYVGFRLY